MAEFKTYTVRSGDILSGIALRYGVDLAQLQRVNRIREPSKIRAGARLRVPLAPHALPSRTSAPMGRLGSLSKAYEVSSGGPGAVSKGHGDHGGVSYGSFQLSSKFNRPAEFLAAEGRPWAGEFAGRPQGSSGFTSAWKAVAARDAERFDEAQHAYIKRTHYDVQVSRIFAKTGLDIGARSRALQDVVWSTAVQHGPASSLIAQVIGALGRQPSDPGFDKALIVAIYAERGRRDADGRLHYFRSSSTRFQEGVARRFEHEATDALARLAAEPGLTGASSSRH